VFFSWEKIKIVINKKLISWENHVDLIKMKIEGKFATMPSYHLLQKLHHKQQPFHVLNLIFIHFDLQNLNANNKYESR
jgi:hypothetical protein